MGVFAALNQHACCCHFSVNLRRLFYTGEAADMDMPHQRLQFVRFQ